MIGEPTEDLTEPVDVWLTSVEDCPAVASAERSCMLVGSHRKHVALSEPVPMMEGPDTDPDDRALTSDDVEWHLYRADQLRLFADAPSTLGAIDALCELGYVDAPTKGAHQPSLDPLDCETGRHDAPQWGDPLPQVIAATAPDPRWLEAAVAAGYLPTLGGVARAVHGIARLFETEVGVRARLDPATAAQHATAAANGVRALASHLDGLVAWLENANAAAMTAAKAEGPTSQPFLNDDIVAAARRGRRAVQRSRHSQHDVERAEARWEEYRWRQI